jgi:beta-glucosidase
MFNVRLHVIIYSILFFGCADRSRPIADANPYQDKVDSILNLMTLEEKIGQLTLFTSHWSVTGPTLGEENRKYIVEGKAGNIFNAHTAGYNRELQRLAVEESRMKIPLLLGSDVIHGHKTIFPIPLAEACTWDLDIIQKAARYSAMEATASGLNWNFNPMVDIARDPRWGRISEGSGEDTYLGSLIAAAKVRGYQGDDLSDHSTMLACVKHFAAYGAAQAGRDYHTVDLSERTLREFYLPLFKAAIDAGSGSVMASFNELNGIPATGNHFLLTEILRNEWRFQGFVVSDYTGIYEMIPHGFAFDLKNAGELAINAGIDMDMQGSVFLNHLSESVKEGKVSETTIDASVRRILTAKFQLGLFDDPYRYTDTLREKEVIYSEEILSHARETARQSIVLLKNEEFEGRKILPLSKSIKRIAIIGPLGDNKEDQLGTWHAAGDASKVVSLLEGVREATPDAEVNVVHGCGFTGDDRSGFSEAVKIAKQSEVVILAVGENYQQSGEAASRSELDLPGLQQQLVEEIANTGKPVVVIVMAGRPLTIAWIAENMPAVLNAWHLGTMAGHAIADVLFGDHNPSGKLTITFPRNVGQIPIFYNMKNTGRPFDAGNKFTSKYLDVPNEPLYPFGYGLSYTQFSYSEIELSKSTITLNDSLDVIVNITNSGDVMGSEIAQLYIKDLVGSVTRPVKELKGFRKITLQPRESRNIHFTITIDDLSFYRQDMSYGAEPGKFKVFVGTSSAETKEAEFELRSH